MKKIFLFILAALTMVCAGCGLISGKGQTKSEKGILMAGNKTCYKIDLGGGAAEDYFTLVGGETRIDYIKKGESYWDGSAFRSGDRHITIIYSEISEGGWIAYWGGKAIYFPPGVSETTVQTQSTSLASLQSEDCFTIDEVREFLPWI